MQKLIFACVMIATAAASTTPAFAGSATQIDFLQVTVETSDDAAKQARWDRIRAIGNKFQKDGEPAMQGHRKSVRAEVAQMRFSRAMLKMGNAGAHNN